MKIKPGLIAALAVLLPAAANAQNSKDPGSSALSAPMEQAAPPRPEVPADTGPRMRSHLESCTRWRSRGGVFVTKNTCPATVAIALQSFDGKHRLERRLQSGEELNSRIPANDLETIGWIGWTCPEGYRPDVAFTLENRQKFFGSSYECTK